MINMWFIIVPIAAIIRAAGFFRMYLLAKSGDNMSTTADKNITMLKKRYTDCFSFQKPVNNTMAFIQRQVNWYSIYEVYEEISYTVMGIYIIGLCVFYSQGLISYDWLLTVGILTGFFYVIICRIFDSKRLKNAFLWDCCDFIDNTLKNRLEGIPAKKRRAADSSSSTTDVAENSVAAAGTVPEKKSQHTASASGTISDIEAVLNEYL